MLCWVDLPLFFCLSPLHVLVCSTNKCLFTLCHYSSYSLAVGWAPCGPAGTRCIPKMDFLSQRLLVGCASTPTALLHRAVNHAFTSGFFTHLWWKKEETSVSISSCLLLEDGAPGEHWCWSWGAARPWLLLQICCLPKLRLKLERNLWAFHQSNVNCVCVWDKISEVMCLCSSFCCAVEFLEPDIKLAGT